MPKRKSDCEHSFMEIVIKGVNKGFVCKKCGAKTDSGIEVWDYKTVKPDCEHFRGMATNEDVCKYYWEKKNSLTCLCWNHVEICPTNGLRFKQRADDEEDSFE